MVKNTPTATTPTVQNRVSGTLAAITTPPTAPRIVAGSLTDARRVDSPADPAMITNVVQATTSLWSFPTELATRPAVTAATTACIASAIVGERVRRVARELAPVCVASPSPVGCTSAATLGVVPANLLACVTDWATTSPPPSSVIAASNASGANGAVPNFVACVSAS
jgi:hypothetical protein